MNEIPIETQLVISIIFLIVFYFLIKQIIKNISHTDDDGNSLINLNKLSKKNREKIGSK